MARTKAQEAARSIAITREYVPDREAMLSALLVVLSLDEHRAVCVDKLACWVCCGDEDAAPAEKGTGG